ncbi:MAG: hypothetical protein ABL921_08630 [Pirellula sp.]
MKNPANTCGVRNPLAFLLRVVYGLILVLTGTSEIAAQDPKTSTKTEKVRCVAMEFYSSSSHPMHLEQVQTVKKLVESMRGVGIRIYDLDESPSARERLDKIAAAYKVVPTELPFLYGMNGTAQGSADAATWEKRLDTLRTMEVFTRQGCSRCANAKLFLPDFSWRYPGIKVKILDVAVKEVNSRYAELIASQKIGGISFPGFWICNQLLVGFDSAGTFGPRIDTLLKRWTYDCELPTLGMARTRKTFLVSYHASTDPNQDSTSSPKMSEPPELGIGNETTTQALEIPDPNATELDESADSVKVPWLGSLNAKRLGMPLFTLLIGLVDGFNPCAMWVLLFLLSVLVNLRDRRKILAVAGTFVVVSGLAYFAFMAAWLNILLLVGFLRWVQVSLAILAIVVGIIHVKDFFALKQGISLSIPESAKPDIFKRVRKIVMAENLFGAIAGAVVLAVLVNIIELLCTAGLPALYNQVLSMQGYPSWINYAYIGLYIVAYMFDDSLMVAGVIITLGHRKLQENEGRWLKLTSGCVVLALGLVLLFKPEWLG